MRRDMAMRVVLGELKSVRDLLDETIARAEAIMVAEPIKTVQALPVLPQEPQGQPVQQPTSPRVKRQRTPTKRTQFTYTFQGPRAGAAAESDRRAIALEVSEVLKRKPGEGFGACEVANMSKTAHRRYPNNRSRASSVSYILKKFGDKFGVRQDAAAKWTYMP